MFQAGQEFRPPLHLPPVELRQDRDPSSELNQWIRANYLSFRDIELNLIQHRL